MGIFDYFRKEKDLFQPEPLDLLETNELQELVEDILSKVESLIIKKAEWFLDNDWYICSKEDFDLMEKKLEEKWFDLEYSAWQYNISRTMKSVNWSTTNILRKFEYIEK